MPTSPIRVLLCTSGGLAGARVMARLAEAPAVELAGVILSSRLLRPGQGLLAAASGFLGRCGAAYTAYLWCSTALSGALARDPAGVAVQARRRGVPLLRTDDVNGRAALDFARRSAPGLLVSAFFNQRIGAALLAVPAHGGVNIHPSLLPEFRGVDPVFRSLLEGRRALGVSVHRLAEELDRGNVLAAAAHAADGASVFRATAALYGRGARLLVAALPRIVAGEAGAPQPAGGGYDSWPAPREVAELRRRGHSLVRLRDIVDLAAGRMPDDGG